MHWIVGIELLRALNVVKALKHIANKTIDLPESVWGLLSVQTSNMREVFENEDVSKLTRPADEAL